MAEQTAIDHGLSPEKQAVLSNAFRIGKNLIYKKAVFGAIVKEVDSMQPEVALAEAIVMVLNKIQQDPSVGPLPFDVAMGAGIGLLGDLVDALQRTGRGPYSPGMISNAVRHGVEMYLQMHGSRTSPQEIQQMMKQLKAGGAQ